MPSPSQYIFGLQAAPLLASGVFTLIWPATAANLPDSALAGLSNGTIQAISMTSLSLGTFYAIAAYQNNIPMMIAAVPGRLMATFVFHNSGGGWAKVAPFEAVMGLFTAVGLYWDWTLKRSKTKKE